MEKAAIGNPRRNFSPDTDPAGVLIDHDILLEEKTVRPLLSTLKIGLDEH